MPAARPARATATLLSIALVAVGGAALLQVRADAAAQEAERRAAQHELDREVVALRTELATPAHVAERTTADLLVAVVESVTGSERDAASVRGTLDRLIADLREAADRIDEAAAQPMPDRPDAIDAETADTVIDRLHGVGAQAGEVAAQLRGAADEAEAFTTAAHELSAAAASYAATTADLPDSDDPDVLATAWRSERERLADYRAAVDRAAEAPGLEELAGSHDALVSTLTELADDAVAALEAGDIDGYNARLAEVTGDDDVSSLGDRLVAATEDALDAATVRELEQARTAVLTLLIDLEDLRRVTG